MKRQYRCDRYDYYRTNLKQLLVSPIKDSLWFELCLKCCFSEVSCLKEDKQAYIITLINAVKYQELVTVAYFNNNARTRHNPSDKMVREIAGICNCEF